MRTKFKVLILAGSALAVVAATTLDSYIIPIGTGIHLLMDNTGSDYDRLCFGGSSASYPALKRSGATIQVRTASDSADADFRARAFLLQNFASTPGTPTNGFVVFAVSNILKCIGTNGTVTVLAQP